jgi:hypothetical protein
MCHQKAFTKDGKKPPPAMEFFESDIKVEEEAYVRKLKGFWTKVIKHAESKLTLIVTLSRNAAMVKKSMPAKLCALQAGLFETVHSNMLFRFFPIPNKAFLNSLHKQTGTIMDAIHEVSNITLIIYHWIEPLSVFGLEQHPPMWMDHTWALEHLMKKKLGLNKIEEVSGTG